jgi:tetratricopeptide (TPR) repeat protein
MIDFSEDRRVSDSQTVAFMPGTVQSLLKLARERATGTITATLPELRASYALAEGRIRDVAFEGRDTLDLVFSEILDPPAYRQASKLAAKAKTTVGEAVLNEGLIDEDQAVDAVVAFVGTTLANVITLQEITFTPGAPDDAAFSDLGANYDIALPLEELLLNALAEHDAWDFVAEHFVMLRDVYYATPSSVEFFHRQADYPAEVAVLQNLDGQKDAHEAIAASGLDPFLGLRVLQSLAESSYVELVNPVQLFQLGLAAEESANWPKALHLYQRALDRGLDDFDLQLRLARALEETGDAERAIERYKHFAEKCMREFRFEDSLQAMQRMTALDPGDVPLRKRYIELLSKNDKKAEAARESIALAKLLHENDLNDEAVAVLREGVEICPDDPEIGERFAELCKACGAQDEAREANERLAKVYADRQDSEKALEHYQQRFVEGEDNLEIREKLIELHEAQGNRATALEHLDTILAVDNPFGIRDIPTMRSLHQKRAELRPSDRESTWFLIEEAVASSRTEEAEAYLRGLISHLNPDDDRRELIGALKRLTRMLPEKLAYLWQLAKEYEKSGDVDAAVGTLFAIAGREKDSGNTEEATRALREILRLSPFNPEAREELIEVLGDDENAESLKGERRQLALLRLIEGNVDRAQALCREIACDRSEDAFLLVLVADLCAKKGDKEKAGEQYARAGKLLVEERNFGLAGVCAEALSSLGTHPTVLDEIRAAIKAGTEKPAAPAPATGGQPPADDEAFAQMKQRTVKGSVASITARLKSIKVGKPAAGAPAAAAAPQPEAGTASAPGGKPKKAAGLGSAINKLKALGKGEASPPAAEPAASAPPDGDDQAPSSPAPSLAPKKPVKLGGAADRLRALKGGTAPAASEETTPEKSAPAPEESGSASPDGPPPPYEPAKPAKLGGAAARLRALKGGAAPAASEETTPEKSAPAPEESDPSSLDGPPSPYEPAKPAKLGGAAARLRALKEGALQT